MNPEQVRHVDEAITSRHSVRAFLSTPVDPKLIRDILSVASHAPSGTNTQPWKVYVVYGQKRDALVEAVCQAQIESSQHPELAAQYKETFAYYPSTWISPFIDRRRENGWGLYGLLGIQKGEKEKMAEQQLRNFKLLMHQLACFLPLIKLWESGRRWIFP
ncbi:nitroreductase [Acinetobacter sp. 272263]|nr:nitroreductase [Acinetobacter sp. 272263]